MSEERQKSARDLISPRDLFLMTRQMKIIGLEPISDFSDVASPELIRAADRHAREISFFVNTKIGIERILFDDEPNSTSRGVGRETFEEFKDAWDNFADDKLLAKLEESINNLP